MAQDSDDASMYLQFTAKQKALLIALLEKEDVKKLAVSFDHEADDQQNIRRTAYLDGGRDMLKYLLDFDAQLVEQKEAEKQRLLDLQPPQNAPAFDFLTRPSF